MKQSMETLFERINRLEKQVSGLPVQIAAPPRYVERSAGALVGVVKKTGSSWAAVIGTDLTEDAVIGYALLDYRSNAAGCLVHVMGQVYTGHAFSVGVSLYCTPAASTLTDVKPTAPDSDRVVAYALNDGWVWIPRPGAANGAPALSDLSDVDTTDRLANDVVIWDGTNHVYGLVDELNLAASGVSADTYGGGYDIPSITVSATGRLLAVTTFNLTMDGDVTGDNADTNVIAWQGKAVAATAPNENDQMVWNASAEEWQPGQLLVNRGEILTRSDLGSGEEIVRLALGEEDQVLMSDGTDAKWYDPFFIRIGNYSTHVLKTMGTSHSFAAGTKYACIILGAAGGGGEGATGSSGSGSRPGSGGGAGETLIIFLRLKPAVNSISYTLGASGAGGAAGFPGAVGGDSTLTYDGATFTAHGGFQAAYGTPGRGGRVDAFNSSLTSDDMICISMLGEQGQTGAVNSVNYNGAGAVTSLQNAFAGRGGRGYTLDYGKGGNGGNSTSSSGDGGGVGSIRIMEL